MSAKPQQGTVLRQIGQAWLMKCDRCGKEFLAYAPTRHFCSRACYRPKDFAERFWKNVDIKGPDDCWLWTSPSVIKGYPSFYCCGRGRRGGQVAWMLEHGEFPKLWVLHKCDVPLCVNPKHLFLGTAMDNNADMIRKGRANPPRGERSGNAKLKQAQVDEIRQRHSLGNITQRKLALEFGVSFKTINKIVLNQRWAV